MSENKNIFKKVLGKAKEANVLAPKVSVPNLLSDKSVDSKRTPKIINKDLEEAKSEFSKICMVIGMETFELHKKGELSFDTLETYLEKATELQNMISDLIKELEEFKRSHSKFNYCECGMEVDKSIKFCPECGKKINDGTVTCSCGKRYTKNDKFCPDCGDNIQLLFSKVESGNVEKVEAIICVCGSNVPHNQKFCFECGRVMEL